METRYSMKTHPRLTIVLVVIVIAVGHGLWSLASQGVSRHTTSSISAQR
jgi:hypothetical protein